MRPLPMPLRIAAGLVATAVEEVQELPRKLVELPVTAVSQALQVSMRVQQRVTELAIRGDRALGALRLAPETPPWARFDEDEPEDSPTGAANGPVGSALVGDWDVPPPRSAPRTVSPIQIARYPAPESSDGPESHQRTQPVAAEADPKSAAKAGAEPAVKASVPPPSTDECGSTRSGPRGLEDYDNWSLPQLRGHFRALSLEQVEELLAWETSHRDRPPYVTMLSNRVASITGR